MFKVITDKYDPIAIYFIVLGSNLYTIKSFSDKQKLREFCTTKPALQQILKDIL